MKRILVTILMLFYMASAMGATVHLHYCMGEFVDASLIHHEEHKCDKCGMVKKSDDNGCCKDEHKTFKTAEHNKTAPTLTTIQAPIAILPQVIHYSYYSSSAYVYIKDTPARANAPPGCRNTIPIYLQIRNLRI